jgi:hypothetical protein
VASSDVLIGALLGAPFAAIAGAYAERKRDTRRLTVAARAVSWSLGGLSQAIEVARDDDWGLLVHAGDELAADWKRYGDTLRGQLDGPQWRTVEDTVRSAIHVVRDTRAGDLDRRGDSKRWLVRFDGLVGEAIDALRPYVGRTPRKYARQRRALREQ